MHDTETYYWRDEGYANFYTISKGHNWFARVQLNGEMLSVKQEAFIHQMVKALNQGES